MGGGRPHRRLQGREGGAGHGRLLAAALKVAADTIGISPDELRQAVRDGQTVAEITLAPTTGLTLRAERG